MTLVSNYKILALWQPRIESPRQIRARFERLISRLREIDPLTRKWYHVSYEGACYDVDELGDRLIDTIVGRVAKGDFGEPQPWLGYHLIAYNYPDVAERPQGLWLDGRVGGQTQGVLWIVTNDNVDPNSHIVSYEIFKAMLLAVADAFEPDWVTARPSSLGALIDMDRYTRPPMPIAWMINLSPPIARLIQPPPGVISQRGADGSLFMAATDETFLTCDADHMAGARAIQGVVDPLNFILPFQTMIDWEEPVDHSA